MPPLASNRRQFLGSLAAPALLLPCAMRASQTRSPARPNIILMMVDDMGFSDIGCYGAEIRTPNLDAIAAQGMRFTQFYNCARCCPTRASLLTGMYPHGAGIGYMEPGNRYNRPIIEKMGLPEYLGTLRQDCVTLPEALRAANYQTFMAGKWHVGTGQQQRPWERGFDRFHGILQGASNHFRPGDRLYTNDQQTAAPADFYSSDAYSDFTAECIRERDPQRPFFAYVAYTAPHWPIQAHPEDIARYRGTYRDGWDALRQRRFARQKELGIAPRHARLSLRHAESYSWNEADHDDMDLRMAVYAAMIDRVDQGIGRILAALRDSGQQDNTLLLFLSDNGACAEPYGMNAANQLPSGPTESNQGYFLPWANASNTPFRLFKHWVHEGGIATPLIAAWPGVIPPNTLQHAQIGHVKDLMATCLDAAGATSLSSRNGRPAQPLRSNSLLPAMRDPSFVRNETLFWEHEGNRAVREGKWKLVSRYNDIHEEMSRVGTGRRTGGWELYDLSTDRGELRDLAGEDPMRVEAMGLQYQQWATANGVRDWESLLRLGGYDQLD